MIGTFILNPPLESRARLPSKYPRKPFLFTVSDNQERNKMRNSVSSSAGFNRNMALKNAVLPVSYNPRKRIKVRRFGWKRGWYGESQAHAIAAKIGWTYRKYARDPNRFFDYAARPTKAGKHKGLIITKRSLERYRKARSYPESDLLARREWFKHKKTPKKMYSEAMFRAKRRFGMLYNASAYQKFIARHVRGARGPEEARRRFRAAVRAWRRGFRNNPVLPGVEYGPSAVQNELYRSPSGRYSSVYRKGYRRLRRIPGGGWRNNQVYRAPSGRYSGVYRKGYRRLRRIPGGGWRANEIWGGTPNPRKRGRRRYSNNPRRHYRSYRPRFALNGAILPYTAYNNPLEAVAGTFERLADVELWTGTILPIAGGFMGTHILSYQGFKLIAPKDTKFEGIAKHGSRLVASVVLSATSGMILKDPDVAAKVLAGGLVAVLGGVIEEIVGLAEYKKIAGMSEIDDLGEDLTEELKARIAEGVRRAVEGEGSPGVSAFVTEQDLRRAPRLGDFLTEEALKGATVGSGLPARAGGGPPHEPLADLEVFQDALADGSLI